MGIQLMSDTRTFSDSYNRDSLMLALSETLHNDLSWEGLYLTFTTNGQTGLRANLEIHDYLINSLCELYALPVWRNGSGSVMSTAEKAALLKRFVELLGFLRYSAKERKNIRWVM